MYIYKKSRKEDVMRQVVEIKLRELKSQKEVLEMLGDEKNNEKCYTLMDLVNFKIKVVEDIIEEQEKAVTKIDEA